MMNILNHPELAGFYSLAAVAILPACEWSLKPTPYMLFYQ